MCGVSALMFCWLHLLSRRTDYLFYVKDLLGRCALWHCNTNTKTGELNLYRNTSPGWLAGNAIWHGARASVVNYANATKHNVKEVQRFSCMKILDNLWELPLLQFYQVTFIYFKFNDRLCSILTAQVNLVNYWFKNWYWYKSPFDYYFYLLKLVLSGSRMHSPPGDMVLTQAMCWAPTSTLMKAMDLA